MKTTFLDETLEMVSDGNVRADERIRAATSHYIRPLNTKWARLKVYPTAGSELPATLATSVLGAGLESMCHFSDVCDRGTSMRPVLRGHAVADEEATQRVEMILTTATESAQEHRAESLHHHDGGLLRSSSTAGAFGSAHRILPKIKQSLDPAGTLNPGKLGL